MLNVTPQVQEAARLARSGNVVQAEAICRQELAADARSPAAHMVLGEIRVAQKNLPEAAECMRIAAEGAPAYAPFLFNYGSVLMALGDLPRALEQFERAAKLNPSFFQYHVHEGLARMRLGQADAGRASLRRAVDTLPNDPRACRQLGEMLRDSGAPDLAARCFERWAAMDMRDPMAPFSVGGAYYRARKWSKAAEAYKRSIARDPRFAHGHALLGETMERLGDDDAAFDAAGKALAIDPKHPTGTLVMARLERKRRQPAPARERLERLVHQADVAPRTRASAYLELGHALEALGEYASAFECFAQGQRIWSEQPFAQTYSPEMYLSVLAGYQRIVEAAPATLWRGEGRLSTREEPVFFVGFPRSGTTLTEQILGAHPRLAPSDEPPMIGHLSEQVYRWFGSYPDGLERLDEAQLAELEAQYWREAEQVLGADQLKGKRLVDKLPLNICHLPLIARVFPRAKVIVALRDPRDCCLSAFVQEFQPNPAMIHFFRLETTAVLYDRVMTLWSLYKEKLGLEWMETKYEDLVDDHEAAARRMISFIGEEWSDEVLRFRETHTRVVKTPSYQSIAEPINRRAVARWKKFEAQMAPVLPVLEKWVKAFGYAE
ncbi:MAG: sulfotransferase [Phycisphaeraceae bacterium]|nr:sulfotransferase [Phycisphaeraceae bacterium]MCW5754819.1 sulfotransferase [Phycisphaeraceae bacterium]